MKKLVNFRVVFMLLLLIGSFSSCKQKKRWDGFVETNKGTLPILCDETFRSIITQQKEVYESSFDSAQIQLEFKSEKEILNLLKEGKNRTAIIGRRVTNEEQKDIIKADSVMAIEHIVAKDAIALIISKQNQRSNISLNELKQLFVNQSKKQSLVFENAQSGIVYYVLQNLNISKPTTTLYALNDLDSVIEYVANSDDAIGFISFAHISDEHAETTKHILNKVKLIPIEMKDSTGKTIATTASQSDICTGEYPLTRPINYLLCNTHEPIGTGFVNFLFKNRGAKIFLKAGLVPAIMPEREFIISTSAVKAEK